MRIGTFIWGLIITIIGVLAVLMGSGLHLSVITTAASVLLILAIGFAIAALMPQRKEQPQPEQMVEQDVPDPAAI